MVLARSENVVSFTWPASQPDDRDQWGEQTFEAPGAHAGTDEERSNFDKTAGAVRRTAPSVVRSLMVGAMSAIVRAKLGI